MGVPLTFFIQYNEHGIKAKKLNSPAFSSNLDDMPPPTTANKLDLKSISVLATLPTTSRPRQRFKKHQ